MTRIGIHWQRHGPHSVAAKHVEIEEYEEPIRSYFQVVACIMKPLNTIVLLLHSHQGAIIENDAKPREVLTHAMLESNASPTY